jgi:hypothetical protein
MRISTTLLFTTFSLFLAAGNVHAAMNRSGTLTTETWRAADGPFTITATATIPSGATITIEPGTAVYLVSGQNFVVANGGRLLAEGTAALPIVFRRVPGSGASWGNIRISGAAGSPESRIAFAQIDGNSGSPTISCNAATVYLDHLTFGTTTVSYLHLDGSSFIVSNCIFPTATSTFEGVHGTGGVKAGGHAIIRDCFFGKCISTSAGYNDVVDFTGGNRPGPIIQFINNVFIGTDDDILDLDGTDAWIEGNIFMHIHRSHSPDSASAISGGNDGGGGTGSRRSVTAIDTNTEQVTCGTHGFTTGQEVVATALLGTRFPSATPALHEGGPYYVRAISTTVVKLYLSAADAIADTNAINFTGTIGTGVTLSLTKLDAISHITVVGNLFYDLDSLATGKEGNFYTILNNTVVSQNNTGSEDTVTGVLNFGDENYHEAAGMYAEGNIIHSAVALVRNYPGAGLAQTVTWNNNIFPPGLTWTGAGTGNTSVDPQLNDPTNVPTPTPANYLTVAAQIRQKFGLQPGSPARGTGPNGTDKGGVRPLGVSISGAPVGTTAATNATLTIGTRMIGNGISSGVGAWQNGSGWTHYKWSLDGGAFSAETPLSTPISVSGLANGTHTVAVIGKNDAGFYQNDPAFGPDGVPTFATWNVDTGQGTDTDSDGIPDTWEVDNGLNPNDPTDAALDADGDGRSNRSEYIAGTNPRNPASNLNVTINVVGAQVHILFTAEANKAYTVQYKAALADTTWQKLVDVPAQAIAHAVDVPDPIGANPQRFYRVTTPPAPAASPQSLESSALRTVTSSGAAENSPLVSGHRTRPPRLQRRK